MSIRRLYDEEKKKEKRKEEAKKMKLIFLDLKT